VSENLLYLPRGDVRALGIPPSEARQAVLQAFRDHAAGLNQSLPKSALMLGPGHGFQSMTAASPELGVATLKWVAIAPVPPGSALPGINGLILVSDHASGVPLAVMDGDEITLIRTAAMSAAAASIMARPDPSSIGFVGCGLQAHAHLEAFLALYPGLSQALCLSRSEASAEALAGAARRRGLAAEVPASADDLLARCDIVISMVPGAVGLEPFLDARLMKPDAFACAVDIGRSWLPESLTAFDVLATDSLAQSKAPYDAHGEPVTGVRFQHDLAGLSGLASPIAAGRRSMFCFRGFAVADLALAHLVLRKAQEAGLGTRLPR
jgi:ornithine cyclodeaminase/alanine dehydrogenase